MELILNSFGTSLQRENELFVISHKDGVQKIHPSQVKFISVSKGARISSDAVLLAIENEIDVLFIDKTGVPQGRVWSVKYGSISTIRRKQADFIFEKKAVDWIKEIIAGKIDRQSALLLSLLNNKPDENIAVQRAINGLNDYKTKILNLQSDVISDAAPSLRGWEGAASKKYFEIVGRFIPEKYNFKGRTRQPSMDPVNCLLNYGYGILYGRIEGALIKAGIDPYLGIFHRDDYNRPVLVFDVIELFRVWVDYVCFNLAMQEAVDDDWFSIDETNGWWLEQLGKRILIQSMNDYFDEIIQWNGLERSRLTHIQLYAHNLATMFMES